MDVQNGSERYLGPSELDGLVGAAVSLYGAFMPPPSGKKRPPARDPDKPWTTVELDWWLAVLATGEDPGDDFPFDLVPDPPEPLEDMLTILRGALDDREKAA